ncbi:enoyl- hydratase [Fusarium albosuccineum]|uniref:Enoyl- hydratase n=1 Tax=Fusarium albosuccineum TaxID=1237068 RepID=A0A8H4L1C2_9HYPO|nr:enoyl- hydratase [Fusarium albosuccineum]
MALFKILTNTCGIVLSPARVAARTVRRQPGPIEVVTLHASGRRYASSFIRDQKSYRLVIQPKRYLSSQASPPTETAAVSSGGDIAYSIVPAPPGGQGTVANIILSNPKRLNSLSRGAIKKLTSTLRSLAQEPDLACVVIQGGPTSTKSPSFSSGANIFEMAQLSSYDEAKQFISELHDACKAMRDLPVVSIAKIDGLCLGGGLELAASCDFRYATHRSTFSMPETRYGIPSVIEARLLANIIGWQKTKEMCYFARLYSSEEVEKWGLVDRSCDTIEALEAAVTEAVTTISSFGPKTMRKQKRLAKIWEESDLVTGVEAGVDSFARMFSDGGSEPHRYMKAFTDRKK